MWGIGETEEWKRTLIMLICTAGWMELPFIYTRKHWRGVDERAFMVWKWVTCRNSFKIPLSSGWKRCCKGLRLHVQFLGQHEGHIRAGRPLMLTSVTPRTTCPLLSLHSPLDLSMCMFQPVIMWCFKAKTLSSSLYSQRLTAPGMPEALSKHLLNRRLIIPPQGFEFIYPL